MRILMTNFMTKKLFFAEKYSFDLQNIYVKKEPETVDCSNQNSFRQNGPDGNRTRVQKSIPCSSTSVVYYFTFPPRNLNKHNSRFSSFMIRPHTQSLICVVSHVVEAWLLKRGCSRSDCCP